MTPARAHARGTPITGNRFRTLTVATARCYSAAVAGIIGTGPPAQLPAEKAAATGAGPALSGELACLQRAVEAVERRARWAQGVEPAGPPMPRNSMLRFASLRAPFYGTVCHLYAAKGEDADRGRRVATEYPSGGAGRVMTKFVSVSHDAPGRPPVGLEHPAMYKNC